MFAHENRQLINRRLLHNACKEVGIVRRDKELVRRVRRDHLTHSSRIRRKGKDIRLIKDQCGLTGRKENRAVKKEPLEAIRKKVEVVVKDFVGPDFRQPEYLLDLVKA